MQKVNFSERTTTPENTALMLLATLPSTRPNLVLTTGLSAATVSRYMRRLHEAGEVHISTWVPSGLNGHIMPVYDLGDHPDAVAPLDAAQRGLPSPSEVFHGCRDYLVSAFFGSRGMA